MSTTLLIALLLLAIGLLAGLMVHAPETRRRGGRILLFCGLFLLPLLLTAGGAQHHLQQSKTTEFCLSCHVMEPYGDSLRVDDSEVVAAVHYQNRLIDVEHACYTCHTNYTMYGDLSAKWNGVRHLLVYYFGTVDQPIELYSPYQNRECLHCHAGARRFEENDFHLDLRGELDSGETSCLECHQPAHDVADLEGATSWSGSAEDDG